MYTFYVLIVLVNVFLSMVPVWKRAWRTLSRHAHMRKSYIIFECWLGSCEDLCASQALLLHGQGDVDELISGFFDFCRVDLGLSEKTAREYKRKIGRFVQLQKYALLLYLGVHNIQDYKHLRMSKIVKKNSIKDSYASQKNLGIKTKFWGFGYWEVRTHWTVLKCTTKRSKM